MGRSANSFAFLLVFVLLALVIYFIYQAATGTGSTGPIDQAALVSEPKKETADPNRFLAPAPEPAPKVEVVSEEPKEDLVVPPPPPDETPQHTPEEQKSPGDAVAEKKADKLPGPPKLDDIPPPGDSATTGEPKPAVSTRDELAPMEQEYRTQAGDTPWLLAVLLLGDGTRWQDLVAANPALFQDGRRAEKEAALPAGVRITIPKDAPAKEESPAPQVSGAEHKIESGDTLSAIMQRFYGESSMSIQREILAANPDLDADLLKVGTMLKLPPIPGKGPKSGT